MGSVFSRKIALTAATALMGLATTPASAATINLNDIGGVSSSPGAFLGFKIAAMYWESVLTDDAVINFDVGFQDLGPDVLGGTSSNLFTYVPIETYYSLLAGDQTTSLDAVAVANLSPLNANGSVSVSVPQYFDPATQSGVAEKGTRKAPTDGSAISSTIAISTANVKALIGGFEDVTDAEIQFSSTFAFDFDPTDGIDEDKYDFIGVAVHEMGHALGFLSGAQDFDYSTGIPFPVDEYWWGYAADLFRYRNGTLDWAFDRPSYFSIDGENPFLDGYFSTGAVNGDGWQASHWKAPGNCSNFLGIMNPYICNGTVDDAKSLDLALLDAIGWDTTVDALEDSSYVFSTADMYTAFRSAVPETATWAQMIVGFGLLGGAARRARKVKVSAKLA